MMNTHPDFKELLRLLEEHGVSYMIVGGYALAYHGYPRFTNDIDVFFYASDENVGRLREALIAFSFREEDLPREIFTAKGNVLTFGVAPTRVDLLNDIDGVTYEEARSNTVRGTYGGVEVTFIGFDDLLKNKRSTPRAKDKADAEELAHTEALHVLDRIIRDTDTKQKRLTEVLRDPLEEYTKGWYMCVPKCFNDTLDIRLTEQVLEKTRVKVWTQGPQFSFDVGDTLYDTHEGYLVWSEALKKIGLCIQVIEALNASPSGQSPGRFSGQVIFLILTPNSERSMILERAKHTMSQDDFVRFLIEGPRDELKEIIEKAKIGK